MKDLIVPVLPNRPLITKDGPDVKGKIRLRKNKELDFIENALFKADLANYDENYQNNQACSTYFVNHMESVISLLSKNFSLNSRIVEVGCGKGDFLELLEVKGFVNAVGFDTSYTGNNPKIFKRYLTENDQLDADIVILRHVLEHVVEPHKFLKKLKNIFKNTKIYIEVPLLDWILLNQAFYDITYEHVNYFSEKSLKFLFANKVDEWGVSFNGQYQYVIASLENSSDYFGHLYDENLWMDVSLQDLFPSLNNKILDIENTIEERGQLYLWGASTKGCMFLIHFLMASENNSTKVGFAVDINPEKCGKFLPGSLVPIYSVDYFFENVKENSLLLISNPNYKAEILEMIKQRKGCQFQVMCL